MYSVELVQFCRSFRPHDYDVNTTFPVRCPRVVNKYEYRFRRTNVLGVSA